jgi:chaperone modulatory protein CbpM
MTYEQYIAIPDLCRFYQIDMSFLNELDDYGLIEVHIFKEGRYVHKDRVVEVEKIIRLRQELNLNLEGIDTVLNLLQRINHLTTELNQLKNKLHRFESQ